jgi:hypothetical protein
MGSRAGTLGGLVGHPIGGLCTNGLESLEAGRFGGVERIRESYTNGFEN